MMIMREREVGELWVGVWVCLVLRVGMGDFWLGSIIKLVRLIGFLFRPKISLFTY